MARAVDRLCDELVSVVGPAHNAAPFVAEAVGSVLAQSRQEAGRGCRVRDGSSDRTAELADSFDYQRVRVIRRSNTGPSRARICSPAITSGNFLAFLDPNDHWFRDKLERRLLSLRSDDRVSKSAADALSIFERQVLVVTGQAVKDSDQERIIRARLPPLPLSAPLFPRSRLDVVSEFEEVLPDAAEDFDLMARVERRRRIVCIEGILGVYRKYLGSLNARKFFTRRSRAGFVRARLKSRDRGGDLSWHEFASGHRPSMRQRYDDLVHAWCRLAGLSVAERDWPRAVVNGLLAALFGPRYTLNRFRRQRQRLVE